MDIVLLLILFALIGLTYYFDRKAQPVLGSISFIFLIVYTLTTAGILSTYSGR
ncbi:MAG: hypothetical protein PHT95_01660 [Candidatus Omnitrophica bacterium]|nr:hypothetical protein [Candidatus Omnitrophota bacterium]MDD4012598.1 hypothetical protein [Candidatus Omnitrophota bacterium]